MKNVGAKLLLLVTIAVAILVMAPGRGRVQEPTSSTVPAAVWEQKMKGREIDAEKTGKEPSEMRRSERESSPAAASMENRRSYVATVFATL